MTTHVGLLESAAIEDALAPEPQLPDQEQLRHEPDTGNT